MFFKRQHLKIIALLCVTAMLLFATACFGEQQQETEVPPEPPVAASASLDVPEITNIDINPLTGETPHVHLETGTRPIAVMVDNIDAALPQTGLSLADVIYETETEGGITRLMAMYSDPEAIVGVGPVRSTRDQFCELAMAQNAIIVNIGTSIYANDLLNYFGYQTVDGMYLGQNAFKHDVARARERGNEHAWYTDSAMISTGIQMNNILPTGGYYPLFAFAPAGETVDGDFTDMTAVNFDFSGVANVGFTYNAETALFEKQYNGQPHIDSLDGEPLAFDNVFLLFSEVSLQPDGLCTKFALTQGTGYYLNGGRYTPVTCQKGNPDEQLKLFDANGDELTVATGKSYIGIIAKSKEQTVVFS